MITAIVALLSLLLGVAVADLVAQAVIIWKINDLASCNHSGARDTLSDMENQ
ncbi:hypothetical protein PBI_MRMAGOO_89 [Mycobacterium phage MrMagoo]|uniref:Uncharacterized protein n=1 Tax=Mycobacterium phage MrMagoo TaxID=1927020 RepID=A0A1L6BYL6_9CAUD|nr:hypothetical protein J4U04_gp089 [Mycobacterium phage MrMagoo]APQ42192.1 hypothetical protein PBI_MRMAGOO_89 [Mycobacterium phage MrMagoo]ARM70267.1 hypothetical protein SEA_GARDENSALSA_89 [Mycobacterium phage GardenSalsa]